MQYPAEEFPARVAPSAVSAAHYFHRPAAEQVASDLFTQRAVAAVTIMNEGEVMVDFYRDLNPTQPNLGTVSYADPIVLKQTLCTPEETGRPEVIGSISITVDRAVVAPAVVNRLVLCFLLAPRKRDFFCSTNRPENRRLERFLPMMDRIVLDGVATFMLAASMAGVPIPRIALNMELIAEGVETKLISDRLVALG